MGACPHYCASGHDLQESRQRNEKFSLTEERLTSKVWLFYVYFS
jgi:hypothetical protein